MKGQELRISFFNTKNGDWGISKFNKVSENYQYWQAVHPTYTQLNLKHLNEQGFKAAEIRDIQNLAEEGWLMTIRAEDDYLIFSAISLVPTDSEMQSLKAKEFIQMDSSGNGL